MTIFMLLKEHRILLQLKKKMYIYISETLQKCSFTVFQLKSCMAAGEFAV